MENQKLPTIEHVVMVFNASATPEAIADALAESTAFLKQCPGFIERQVSYSEEKGAYLDYILWEDDAKAEAAAELFPEAPETQAFQALLDAAEVMHLSLVYRE